MMKPIRLDTSEREYDRICEMVDGRGRIDVQKGVIRRLIVDHSRILAALQELGIGVTYQQQKGKI
jgi:hypothetical protein